MRYKSLIWIYILPLLAFVFSSCEDNTRFYRTGRVVIYYATISDYNLPKNIVRSYSKVEAGKFSYRIDIVDEDFASVLDVIEQNDNADRYIELQAKYKDYPKHPIVAEEWFPDGWRLDPCCSVIIDSLVGIEITALEDWNSNYPKGSLLNSIFEVSYSSLKRYIDSGFTTDRDKLFTCRVDDVSTTPIELLELGITYLTTTQLPAVESPNVNVKYYFSSGNILECQTVK